jgi:hypothetical protein
MDSALTPGDLEAVNAAAEALAKLERALLALSDGLVLAADELMRAQQKQHLTDEERAQLHGRAFQRTLEEIQSL